MSVVDCLTWAVHRSRYMFYLVTPSETMYSDVKYVPRLVVEVSLLPPSIDHPVPWVTVTTSGPADVPLLHPVVVSGERIPSVGWEDDFPNERHRRLHQSGHFPGLSAVSIFASSCIPFQSPSTNTRKLISRIAGKVDAYHVFVCCSNSLCFECLLFLARDMRRRCHFLLILLLLKVKGIPKPVFFRRICLSFVSDSSADRIPGREDQKHLRSTKRLVLLIGFTGVRHEKAKVGQWSLGCCFALVHRVSDHLSRGEKAIRHRIRVLAPQETGICFAITLSFNKTATQLERTS